MSNLKSKKHTCFNQIEKIFFFVFLLGFIFQDSLSAANYFSIASGNWNSPSTWSNNSGGTEGSSVPSSTDQVIIEGGFTVIVNANSSCSSLTIGSSSTGALSFNSSQTLTVYGSVTIVASKGTLNMSSGGSLVLTGNFINAGIFTAGTGTLIFNGNTQQIIQSSTANKLILDNSAGLLLSNSTTELIISNVLTLTNGEFNLNGKSLKLTQVSPIIRTNGTIDASASSLNFNPAFSSTIAAGFTNKNILNLYVSSSTNSFLSDTIKVTTLVHGGTPRFNTLWFTGTFSYTRTGNVIGWLDAANSTLIIGDGTTRSTSFWYQILSNPLPNLIVDCGSGTLLLERTLVNGGTPNITKSIFLKSGVFKPGPYLTSFQISNNVKITRKSGKLMVNTGNYIVGTGIEVTYIGNSNDTIGDEVKSGRSIAKLTINLSDHSKTICTKSGRALNLTNDLIISSGSLALADTLSLEGNLSIAANGSTFVAGNNKVILNGSTPQALTNSGGANLSFSHLNIANTSSGVTLNSPTTIHGTLTLSSGVFNLNNKELTMAIGSSLCRGNGSISNPLSATSSYNVSYVGSSSIASTPELFPISGNINDISIALSVHSSSISTTLSDTLNPLGNIHITNGTLVLQGSCRIAPGKSVTVTNPASLNTGGNLILSGSSSTPAYIASSTGAITGSIKVELLIPGGRRAYRILGHPFSSSIALSSISDDIPVTGIGGSINGFDSTFTNNPSAFTFDETQYTGSANSGWTAFSNTNQSISPFKSIRVFYRGPRSQANLLNGSNPTPEAGIISISGNVNSGTLTLPLSYTSSNGVNAGWNILANPYPSNIDLGGVSEVNRNTIGTFSIWNPYLGTRGGYSTQSFGSSFVLPLGGAFLVKTSTPGNFSFNETDKVGTAQTSTLLKAKNVSNAFEISLYSDDTILWDKWEARKDELAKSELDNQDGFKPLNPEVNLFSIIKDSNLLAIDVRNEFSQTEPIELGFTTSSPYHFTFKFSKVEKNEKRAFLIDMFANEKILIEQGKSYNFNATSDKNSQGGNRFKIVFESIANGYENLSNQTELKVYPNPATDFLTIESSSFSFTKELGYSIFTLEGKMLMEETSSIQNGIATSIPVNALMPGIYILRITSCNGTQTTKFIKN